MSRRGKWYRLIDYTLYVSVTRCPATISLSSTNALLYQLFNYSLCHSRLACSRLSAHIQPSVKNPDTNGAANSVVVSIYNGHELRIFNSYIKNYILFFVPGYSRNILVKSVLFCLEQFQRYGVLKNVQLFGPPFRGFRIWTETTMLDSSNTAK